MACLIPEPSISFSINFLQNNYDLSSCTVQLIISILYNYESFILMDIYW